MKDKNTLLWLFAIVALVMSAFAITRSGGSAEQDESAFERVFSSREIKVGYIVFPPTVVKDPNTGELSGHFVETMREIASQADLEVEFIETDWTGFAAGLQSGRFDVTIAPTFITIPRSVSVSFTDPLFYAGNGAIVRSSDTRFTDMASFNREDITIAVTQGTAAHEFAIENLPLANIRVLTGPDQFLTLQDVLSGRADAGFADIYNTTRFAATHPNEVRDVFADDPYNLTPVSWAVATDEPELLTFFNNALRALETQGKLDEFEIEAGANWLHVRKEYVLIEQP